MDFMQDLERLSKIWEKAQEKNIFGDVPKPQVNNTAGGFFGQQVDFTPTAGPSAADSENWNKVVQMSNHWNAPVDQINESRKILAKKIQEAANPYLKDAATSPNPVAPSTAGPDSEQIDATFNEKDIEDLSALKNKLHELHSKLCEFEGTGKDAKKFETQMNSVKKEVENLSNAMTRSFYVKERS
jgi:hypothetical protein